VAGADALTGSTDAEILIADENEVTLTTTELRLEAAGGAASAAEVGSSTASASLTETAQASLTEADTPAALGVMPADEPMLAQLASSSDSAALVGMAEEDRFVFSDDVRNASSPPDDLPSVAADQAHAATEEAGVKAGTSEGKFYDKSAGALYYDADRDGVSDSTFVVTPHASTHANEASVL